jgi:lipid II:glycine glycyltransferase (peptidoglycan interpeptide bridge formation enzyme)
LKQEWGTAFIQLGIINEITSFENMSHRSGEFNDDVKKQRLTIQKQLFDDYGLQVAFRENMPQSNIIYDVSKTDEELIAEMNSGCKERIKKAMKKNISFRIARPDEYDVFYQKRCNLGGKK